METASCPISLQCLEKSQIKSCIRQLIPIVLWNFNYCIYNGFVLKIVTGGLIGMICANNHICDVLTYKYMKNTFLENWKSINIWKIPF